MIDDYRQRMRSLPMRRRWLTVTGIVAGFCAVFAFLIGLAFGDGILGALLFGLIFFVVVALVWAALTYRLERRV
jgi:drug/metabolite transporter (DMT)-like permease